MAGAGADIDSFRGAGYHELSADGSFTTAQFTGHGHAYAGIVPSFAGMTTLVASLTKLALGWEFPSLVTLISL